MLTCNVKAATITPQLKSKKNLSHPCNPEFKRYFFIEGDVRNKKRVSPKIKIIIFIERKAEVPGEVKSSESSLKISRDPPISSNNIPAKNAGKIAGDGLSIFSKKIDPAS